LARAWGRYPTPFTNDVFSGTSRFATADGEYVTKITYLSGKTGYDRVEIGLCRNILDPDSNPATIQPDLYLANAVSLSYTFNRYKEATIVDAPLLRSALSSFVTPAIELKLLSGEM
jgi:hypothetical protein